MNKNGIFKKVLCYVMFKLLLISLRSPFNILYSMLVSSKAICTCDKLLFCRARTKYIDNCSHSWNSYYWFNYLTEYYYFHCHLS